MNVVCLFSDSLPNEVQMAYGDGAGSVQLVAASRLLREQAEMLLSLQPDEPYPAGRGETGDVGAFKGVVEGDVCVQVRWTGPDARPEVDFCIGKAATPDQLLCCALALDEYVRFGIWNNRMTAQAQLVQQHQAHERAAAAIARAAHMPPDLGRIGRA